MNSTELYICRINAVIDFIENHLDEKLSLEELSRVAQFSQFHFHRIFSAFMGGLGPLCTATSCRSGGLQQAEGYCFEHYFADCYDPDSKKTAVSIAVPVKEL